MDTEQVQENVGFNPPVTANKRGAGRPRRFTREEAQALRRRKTEDGLTLKQLREETGISVGTLQRIVNAEGAYADTL